MGWLSKYEDGGEMKPKILQDFEKYRTSSEGKDYFRMMEENRIAKKNSGRIDYSEIDPITDVILGGGLAKDVVNKGLKTIGKNLTEKTILKDTYKINPFSFKPNPEAYYRAIGQEGYDDALKSQLIRANQIKEQRLLGNIDITKNFSQPYFAPANKFNALKDYNPSHIVEVTNTPMVRKGFNWGSRPYDVIDEGNKTQLIRFKNSLPVDNNTTFYKKNWLRGYKEITKKENGGKMQEHQPNFNNSSVSIPQGFVGQGETIRNWKSGSWNGQFKEGGQLTKLDQLVNFTNYNKPTKGGWLEKYSK